VNPDKEKANVEIQEQKHEQMWHRAKDTADNNNKGRCKIYEAYIGAYTVSV